MDKSDVINLIKVQDVQDEQGVVHKRLSKRSVFCSVNSVSANEFFNGGRNGLNPQYQFTLNRFDYNNELLVEYNGQRYAVYRTYIGKNDNIELYVELRKGIENEDQG